jgi:hypothetical protein
VRTRGIAVIALALAATVFPAAVASGSASVRGDSCTTPVFQNGLDVVFGRGSTQAKADKITRQALIDGFKGVETVRDTCKVWKSALRGLNAYDAAVGVQAEARHAHLYPTIECVKAEEIGQLQAIFGTRRTLADLQTVLEQAARFGYTNLKTKTAPCGGYQAYIAGFASRAQADNFAQEASQRSGLHVVIVKA